ncbi:MAG: helix-turn-helix domain-containing protein [Firmicutes bacterium]|nr:helix-turn-helix domain-containing protein [Bacillota bacterium]
MEKKSFGKKLKELRKKKNLTQSKLAKKFNIATSTVGMYEQDRREPNFEMIIKLCRFFSVPADYFIGFSEDPEKHFMSGEIKNVIYNFTNYLSKMDNLMMNGTIMAIEDRLKISEIIKESSNDFLSKNMFP